MCSRARTTPTAGLASRRCAANASASLVSVSGPITTRVSVGSLSSIRAARPRLSAPRT